MGIISPRLVLAPLGSPADKWLKHIKRTWHKLLNIPPLEPERLLQPQVSVLLPIHKHGDMLKEITHSVLFGSYPNLELIILDHGSNDENEPLLSHLSQNPRVRILRQSGLGLAHAHLLAGGQFIAWMPEDAFLTPGTIDKLVEALLTNPEALLVSTIAVAKGAEKEPAFSEDQQPSDSKQKANIPLQLSRQVRLPEPGTEVCLYRREAIQALSGVFKNGWRSMGESEYWSGVEINSLSGKTRRYQTSLEDLSLPSHSLIIGCHFPPAEPPIDVHNTRKVIENNPGIIFAFLDDPSNLNLCENLTEGLTNSVHLGSHPFGEAHRFYAAFDAVWLPPTSTDNSKDLYRSLLALAYAAGRPLLAPFGLDFFPAPNQYCYYPPDDSLAFASELDRSSLDDNLLDRYLQSWKPSNRQALIDRLAEVTTGAQPAPATPITPWTPRSTGSDAPLKCALAVSSLDKGGLEELIAQLVLHLPEYGIEGFVICTQNGGAIADQLTAQGVRVYNAAGDGRVYIRALQKEGPDLINTHFVDLDLLKAAHDLNIPIVETIHSPYVWLDREAWQDERQRSRYFSHAIATSQITRRYYIKWNNIFPPESITVIPTGIDVQRIQLADRDTARVELSLSHNDFLFLMLASYDGNKNHLGVLTAFDQVALQYPQARLLTAGNVANAESYRQILKYHHRLKARDRVQILEYYQDIGLLLSAADAFIVNSFSEGWSLSATEALTAGLPLIHSDCGSAYEIVGERGERGAVIPNPATSPININMHIILETYPQKRQRNTDILSDTMAQMIQERHKWAARRDEMRIYASQAFTITNTLTDYAALFRSNAALLHSNAPLFRKMA